MNIKFFSPLVVSILLLVGVSNANAKGQPTPHQREVQRCDHDAHVAAGKLKAEFNTVDSNQNGSLEKNETAATKITARCFRHLDRNNDGVLSTTELQRMS